VIDGLDEAEAQGWSPKFLLPRKAPARVHIVFSARNIAERNWIEWLGLSEPDVRARELHALALPAVAALLRQAPALSAKADDATFVAELFAVSDGDPMYLRLLIEDLAKAATQGMPTVHDVSIKPKGLDNYLKAWWNDLAAQQKAGPAVRDLLGYLLVARGALPRDVLIDVDEHDHLDSVSVDDAIARIRRYVVGDEQAGFRFGHPRLRRYLIGDRLRPSDLRGVAVALARWCEGAWPGADNRYAAQFVIGQLREQRDRCAPAERPAITGRMLALLRNDEFRRRRNDDPEGLLHDESDFADVLGAALADPLPEQLPSLAEAVLATAGLQHTLGERVLRIFDRARGGAPDSAAKMLPPLAPDARWLAAMLLVCCGLAALAGREGAAKFRRACSDAIRPEAFDATLQLLDQRVDALLRAEPPRPESWPLPYPPGLLPVESVNGDIARAIVTRMGGGGDAELLAAHLDPSMIASINRGLSPDGLPVYLAERDSPWLVAQAMRAAAGHDGMTRDEAEELIRRYIAAHATNPYREYRHRSLWAVLGAVLAHPDPGTALDGARAVCEAAAQPVSVDFREMLRLAGLGLAARLGDSAAAGMLAQCVVGARDAAKELRQVRGGADTWGAHARRFAALAEVHGVALGDALGAAGLLADAHGLPFGYAGFQASASLAVADAEFVCRPADAASLHDALDAARRAAHNVQEARFCALTTARVHTICTRWRPGSVADLADVVERFAREPLAAEFAPRHVAGEDYGERDDGPHMLSLPDAVRQARTLEAIARDVFALPWDRVARLNAGAGPRDRLAEVAVPDPGFVPLLASRLASELLARRAVLGASAAVLMARLVPAAAGDATALDAVMARLALAYAPADAALVQRLISVAPTDWMRSPIPNRNVEA
ncbi:MAG TPA: hypothetical protein VJ598_01055, partial [Albitalea sp.]|nr:hypothetical protein [Albitalea sp.]